MEIEHLVNEQDDDASDELWLGEKYAADVFAILLKSVLMLSLSAIQLRCPRG